MTIKAVRDTGIGKAIHGGDIGLTAAEVYLADGTYTADGTIEATGGSGGTYAIRFSRAVRDTTIPRVVKGD